MKKLDYINSMRGLAILGVILVHTSQYGLRLPSIVTEFTSKGALGVQLFFVASAFTLMLSINNRKNKTESNPKLFFFLRRFFRIAPMYYLGIVYYIFQNFILAETFPSTGNIITNIFFIHGLSPYWINTLVPGGWSISVEIFFYAFIIYTAHKIKNISVALNLLSLSLLLRCILFVFLSENPLIAELNVWHYYIYLFFPNQFPVFIIGLLMYFIIVTKQSPKPSSVMFFALISLIGSSFKTSLFFPEHIIFSFLFLLLGYSLSKFPTKLIVNSFIGFIGKISFSLYLTHFAVLFWLNHLNLVTYTHRGTLDLIIMYIFVLGTSCLISYVTYNIVEVPFQNLGKLIIRKLERNA